MRVYLRLALLSWALLYSPISASCAKGVSALEQVIAVRMGTSARPLSASEKLEGIYQLQRSDLLVEAQLVNKETGVLQLDKIKRIDDANDGAMNTGLWRGEKNGKTYIVKGLDDNPMQESNPFMLDLLLNEARNAKAFENLGIGPSSYLVKSKNGKFTLAMEEAPGMNLKELLVKGKDHPTKTKEKIEKVLGIKTPSLEEAKRLYAQLILDDPASVAELNRIAKILKENDYALDDLQIMVRPGSTREPSSVQIIDSAGLVKGGNMTTAEADPLVGMHEILRQLKDLAGR